MTLATLATGALTLAALAASTLDRYSAESTGRSIANVARWTTTGQGPLRVRDLENVPAQLNAATWKRWSKRLADHVDEADLEIASPSVRARAFEKLD